MDIPQNYELLRPLAKCAKLRICTAPHLFTGFIWYGTGQGAVHKNCEKIKKVVDSLKLSCYKEWGEPLKKNPYINCLYLVRHPGPGAGRKKSGCQFACSLLYCVIKSEGGTMQLTMKQYHAECYDHAGYCTACKQLSYGHEPDARRQECELCGEHRVYGLEEAVMSGLVTINEG